MAHTLILWDCNGKLEATLFCSNRRAFNLVGVDDQMEKIAVKVSTTADFDEEHDYLVRVVSKNGGLENQLVFGTLPKWAGGALLAARCLLASGNDTTRLLKSFPPTSQQDKETLRQNGIRKDDEDCMGK